MLICWSGFQTSMRRDLTEFPLPLIIKGVGPMWGVLGVGGTTVSSLEREGRGNMKVSVYKGPEGKLSVLVQASPGKGRPPVVIPEVTLQNIQEKVLPLVEAMRKPKGEGPRGL